MFFWIILNGDTGLDVLIFGTVISIAIIFMTNTILFRIDEDILRLPPTWRFIWFGAIVLKSIVMASFQHVYRIQRNESRHTFFEVELTTHNIVIITLIANAITLTPGTITVNVEDRTLEVLGFARNESDIQKMIAEILEFQKPFLYRRK